MRTCNNPNPRFDGWLAKRKTPFAQAVHRKPATRISVSVRYDQKLHNIPRCDWDKGLSEPALDSLVERSFINRPESLSLVCLIMGNPEQNLFNYIEIMMEVNVSVDQVTGDNSVADEPEKTCQESTGLDTGKLAETLVMIPADKQAVPP